MSKNLELLFKKLWDNYIKLTPSASKINNLLINHGEKNIINDHIALRTCDLPGFGIKSLAEVFEQYGYKIKQDYRFEEKKLNAVHLEYSQDINLFPKVFISEICLDQIKSPNINLKDLFSNIFRSNLLSVFDNKNTEQNIDQRVLIGAPWQKEYSVYKDLSELSEYAGWLYAWGLMANHFTISINHLDKIKDIQTLNKILLKNNFELNKSGGLIKGNKECFLEQSSIMADKVKVEFLDGQNNIIYHQIPCCFYEFAQRYPMGDGSNQLYQGFVTDNANKIFESTNG